MYGLDTEALLYIESKDSFKLIEYNRCHTSFQVTHSCEVNFSSQGYEERHTTDKENDSGQRYCLLEISNFFGNLDMIQSYHSMLVSDSCALQGTDIIYPYLLSGIDIMDQHFAIFDLVVF